MSGLSYIGRVSTMSDITSAGACDVSTSGKRQPVACAADHVIYGA